MATPKIDHFERVADDRIQQATIDGVACWAFTVRSGDVQDFDRVESNRGPNGQFNERAEISYAPAQGTLKVNSPVNVKEGMLQTYDIDLRFKAGFPPHDAAKHEWGVLAQFHPQDTHRAGAPNGFGGVTVHNGSLTFDDPMGSGNYFATVPIRPDVWIKLRMVVKWSAGHDGYAKIVDRGTGAQIGRYDGQTITAGEFKYLKQGYYRAGGLPEGTVYQTQIGITEGDMTETGTTTPAPAQGATTATVQTYAAQLLATRNAMKAEVDAISALLGKP